VRALFVRGSASCRSVLTSSLRPHPSPERESRHEQTVAVGGSPSRAWPGPGACLCPGSRGDGPRDTHVGPGAGGTGHDHRGRWPGRRPVGGRWHLPHHGRAGRRSTADPRHRLPAKGRDGEGRRVERGGDARRGSLQARGGRGDGPGDDPRAPQRDHGNRAGHERRTDQGSRAVAGAGDAGQSAARRCRSGGSRRFSAMDSRCS